LGKRSGGLGTTLVLALVIVVLGVALGVGLARFGETLPLVGPLLGEKPPRTTTGPVVVEGIRELDQLATVRWTESVPVTRESGGDVWERVFGGEKVLLIATGNVEAGVDLGDIREDDVSVKGDVVTIDLPEAEILSASLDEETTRVYDRDFSPLNLHPDDELVEQARLRAVGKISASARENGILDTAESNAEESIRAFVTTLGFEKVKFR
jgi:predicted RNA-binding protein